MPRDNQCGGGSGFTVQGLQVYIWFIRVVLTVLSKDGPLAKSSLTGRPEPQEKF